MSRQVDNRVVQMQFDNKKFEEGIKTTLTSLNKLDTSLNALNKISLSGFEKIGKFANSINFDKLGEAAEMVSSRMSSMGIVGATVLQNLTNQAIGAAKHLANITIGQIMSGGKNRALNIENAKFQLQGLQVEWDAIKDDISYAVNETAYGLDEAAQAASQLVASNVQLGTEMQFSLRAISGVAAMTNRSYSETASIFTTVAGNGRLMTDQLNQMASRGLNAAATLGEQLGKTEAEIREMVSKGQIDFKTFAKAMDDAFGEHAKEANKTFTGALSNMKASLSRIGAEFYTPGLEYARDVFNSITGAVNQLKSSMADYHVFENASAIMKLLSENATAFFGSISDKTGMNKFAGVFLKKIGDGLGLIRNILNNGLHTDIIKALVQTFQNLWKMVRAVGTGIKDVFPVNLLSEIRNFVNSITAHVTEFDKTASVYMKVRNTVRGIASILKTIVNYIMAIGSLAQPIIKKIGSGIKEILGLTGKLGNEIFKKTKTKDQIFADVYNSVEKLRQGFYHLKTVLNNNLETINQRFKKYFGKTIPELIDTIKIKLKELFSPKESKEAKEGIDWFGILEGIINGVTKALLLLIDVFGTFYKVLGGHGNLFEEIGEKFHNIVGTFNAYIAFFKGDANLSSYGLKTSKGFEEFITGIRDGFKNFEVTLSGVWNFTKDIFGNLLVVFKDALGYIKPAIVQIGEMLKTVTFGDILKAGAAGGGIVLLKSLFDGIKEVFSGGPLNNLADALSPIGDFFTSLKTMFGGEQAKSEIDQIKQLAITIGILTGSILLLSSIEVDKLRQALVSFTFVISELIGGLYILNEADLDMKAMDSAGDTILHMSEGVLMLAISMKMLSSLDVKSIIKSFFAVAGLLSELGGALYLISNYIKNMPAIGKSLLAMSAAILILTMAMRSLAKLDTGGLLRGLIGIGVLLGEIAGFAYLLQKAKITDLDKVALSLILFAVALNMLIPPLVALALLNAAGQWGVTLTGLAIILGELAAFSAVMTEVGTKDFLKLAASLIVFAVALNMFIPPLITLGALALTGTIGPAILGLAFLLAEIAGFSALMQGIPNFAGVAASLIILAVALNMLIIPLAALAVISKFGDMLVVLTSLGVLLAELAIFTAAMTGVGNLALVGAGLIVFAAALTLLMVPLGILSALSSSGALTKALGSLALLILILAGFAAVMGALSTIGAGILMVGLALLAAGAGAALFGAGLLMVSNAVFNLVAAFLILITTAGALGDSFISMAETAANGIVAFIVTLANAGPQLTMSVVKLIAAICNAIKMSLTTIVSTIGDIILGILQYLANNVPKMISSLLELVFGILDGLINGLKEKVPVLAQDLYDFCMILLDATVKLIKQTPMDLFDIFFGGGFEEGKNTGKKFKDFFKGIFDKNKDSEEVKEAGENTAEAMVDSAAETLESNESQDKIGASMDGLIDGATSKLLDNSSLSSAMGNLSESGLEGFEDPLNIVNGKSMATADIASFATEGFLSEAGSKESISNFYNTGKLGGTEYIKGLQDGTGVQSPSWKAKEIAEYVDKGFAIGVKNSHAAEDATNRKANSIMNVFGSIGESVSNMDFSKLSAPSLALDLLSSLNTDITPTISPVLDLANVNSGFSTISSMFASQRSIDLASDAMSLQDAGRSLTMQIQNGKDTNTNNNINALGYKLDKLGDAILNRQIVLDSGELVGGLVNPMDRSLGVKAIMAQRA